MAIKKKEEAQQPVVEVSQLQQFFDKNKKLIYGCAVAAIVIVVCVFAYITFYSNPRKVAASNAVAAALNLLGDQPDSTAYATALYGDGNTAGFEEILDQYGKRAIAANLYAAISEMNLGNFESAKAYLKAYKTDDPIFAAAAISASADCDVELGQYADAARGFEKAAATADNIIAARYLFKAGLAYEKLGQTDKALEVYKKIKSRYPASSQASTIDIYISKLETE